MEMSHNGRHQIILFSDLLAYSGSIVLFVEYGPAFFATGLFMRESNG